MPCSCLSSLREFFAETDCSILSHSDLLQSRRHQADQLRSLESQVKALTTKEASKTKAEEDQPILTGMKMIQGGGSYVFTSRRSFIAVY